MKVRIDIHTYPTNGDDSLRQHRSLGFDDVCPSVVEAAAVAVKRELRRLLEEDAAHA
jgi:hypothetical protein